MIYDAKINISHRALWGKKTKQKQSTTNKTKQNKLVLIRRQCENDTKGSGDIV